MEDKHELLEGIGGSFMALRRRGRQLLAEQEYGLTFEQVVALMSLTKHEGLRICELADIADRDNTTTSRMIRGLEKKGLVVRVPDRQDARQKLIYMTRMARERIEDMSSLLDRITEEFLAGLTQDEIVQTAAVLHKMIRRVLGEDCQENIDATT